MRPSEDAGHYLCDFIYYSSLAEVWKRKERKRVLFLHVPGEHQKEDINRGVHVVTTVIEALVDTGTKAPVTVGK